MKLRSVRQAAAPLLALICITGIVLTWQQPGFQPPGPLVDSERFGEYEVKIYRREDENLLEKICDKLPPPFSSLQDRIPGVRGEWNGVEIRKAGRRVYAQYGCNLAIAELGSNRVAGLDITGDGIPKLALTDQLGRQGGGSLLLFACGKDFHQIANIESWGAFPELRDLDGDGVPELMVSDNAFYHWPVCMDGEPLPAVALRWRAENYTPAGDLMVKDSPSQEALETLALSIRNSHDWNAESCQVPEALWTNAVALMYGGHEDLGWRFIEMAWKPGFPNSGYVSKEDLIAGLRDRLEESVYWPRLHNQMLKDAKPLPEHLTSQR
jgi:hypothetical protein